MADLRAFHKIVEGLLADLRARGPPADDDTSIAAHLMRIRDPATGKPLPDEQLLPEARRHTASYTDAVMMCVSHSSHRGFCLLVQGDVKLFLSSLKC